VDNFILSNKISGKKQTVTHNTTCVNTNAIAQEQRIGHVSVTVIETGYELLLPNPYLIKIHNHPPITIKLKQRS